MRNNDLNCAYGHMATWGLGHNISESVRDRDLDPMEHQQQVAHWDSNGHVTDDVTWPRKVKVMIQIYLGPIISKTAGDTDLVPMKHL